VKGKKGSKQEKYRSGERTGEAANTGEGAPKGGGEFDRKEKKKLGKGTQLWAQGQFPSGKAIQGRRVGVEQVLSVRKKKRKGTQSFIGKHFARDRKKRARDKGCIRRVAVLKNGTTWQRVFGCLRAKGGTVEAKVTPAGPWQPVKKKKSQMTKQFWPYSEIGKKS